MLILYAAISAKSLINSNSFLTDSLGFSIYHQQIMILLLFCLDVLAKTSGTMLNRSGESGHPCLVLDVRGKAFSFSSIEYSVSSRCGNYAVYYIESCSLYTQSVKDFYHKRMVYFVKCYSVFIEIVM